MIYVTHHLEELEYLEAKTVQLNQGRLQTMPKLEII